MKIIFDSALVMKNRRQGHKPVSSIFGKAHGKDGPFGTDKHLMQAPELSGAFFAVGRKKAWLSCLRLARYIKNLNVN